MFDSKQVLNNLEDIFGDLSLLKFRWAVYEASCVI